jgi:uncharacterized protein YndB with AHSA1/START domain
MNAYATQIATETVRIERMLPGPIERVWTYLVEPARRASWLAGGAMQLEVGGVVELVFHNNALTGQPDDLPPPQYAQMGCEFPCHGRIVECDPPRVLAHTWGEGSGDESLVRFELSEQGDQVFLRVTHSRLPDREQMLSVAGGWHTHLDILVDRLHGRAPKPFWTTHTRLEAEYARRLVAASPSEA